ncbi:twin-arginine translocation signal domain-containing protein, partial [Carboxylicivirga sp. M1479]
MTTNRRSFLKNMGLAAGVAAAAPMAACNPKAGEKEAVAYIRKNAERVPKM